MDDLPSEVWQRVLSFLDCSERRDLILVFRNRRVLEEIETYFQSVCERIPKEHRTDETFEARVNDQSDLRSKMRRKKPFHLSWRYRAAVAMKQPLWTLAVVSEHYDNDNWPHKLVLSPLEDRIAVLVPDAAHVYKLATREHVDSFGQNPFHDCLKDVFLLDHDRVFTHNYDYWRGKYYHLSRIWTRTESGEWSDERLLPEGTRLFRENSVVDSIPRNDNEIIFLVTSANRSQIDVASVNIENKSLRNLFSVAGFSKMYYVHKLQMADGKWLLFIVTGGKEKGRGLYVYNLETNQQTDFHETTERNYFVHGLLQASDCPRTFFSIDGFCRTVVVWDLSDTGLLSERCSFPVGAGGLLSAMKSHVFIRFFNPGVGVYNVNTGKCCRCLDFDDAGSDYSIPSVISNSRDELYMAGPGNRIKAFCLKEPSIM